MHRRVAQQSKRDIERADGINPNRLAVWSREQPYPNSALWSGEVLPSFRSTEIGMPTNEQCVDSPAISSTLIAKRLPLGSR